MDFYNDMTVLLYEGRAVDDTWTTFRPLILFPEILIGKLLVRGLSENIELGCKLAE